MKKINNYFEAEQIREDILHIRFLSFVPAVKDNEELLSMFVNLMKGQAAGKKCVFIFDCKNLKLIGSETRIRSGQWAKDNTQLFSQALHALVFYNAGLMLEFVLKGVFLFSKPPVPIVTFKSEGEAFDNANKLLGHKLSVAG
jgi:hypothetical protein